MREIVHIQAGQCGNQIGAKVRNVLLFQFQPNLNLECLRNGRHFVTPVTLKVKAILTAVRSQLLLISTDVQFR